MPKNFNAVLSSKVVTLFQQNPRKFNSKLKKELKLLCTKYQMQSILTPKVR